MTPSSSFGAPVKLSMVGTSAAAVVVLPGALLVVVDGAAVVVVEVAVVVVVEGAAVVVVDGAVVVVAGAALVVDTGAVVVDVVSPSVPTRSASVQPSTKVERPAEAGLSEVRAEGIEPSTYGLRVHCSAN